MTAGANLDDSAQTDDAFSQTNQMTWPMLPGESIAALASKFYPNNRIMQQRFIATTLDLNRNDLAHLNAQTSFDGATAIEIPTLKSLAQTGVRTRHRMSVTHKKLNMSYKLDTAASTPAPVKALPKKLNDDYEQLVLRNERLKMQLTQLNSQLLTLQNQAMQLKLPLEKALSLQLPPQTTHSANLSDVAPHKSVQKKTMTKQAVVVDTPAPVKPKRLYGWYLVVLALGLLAWFVLSGFKKRRDLLKTQLLNANEVVMTNSPIDATFQPIEVPHNGLLNDASLQMDAHKEQAILEEAKILVKRNLLAEAIAHLKWAISTKPRIMIGIWLYLLDLFRQMDLRDDFEKYAFELHQQFNVMTPLWDHQEVEMVISETLEDFSHIAHTLTELWPSDDSKYYLQSLIADNRSGERLGFSQAVIDEMLLLIALQALCNKPAS